MKNGYQISIGFERRKCVPDSAYDAFDIKIDDRKMSISTLTWQKWNSAFLIVLYNFLFTFSIVQRLCAESILMMNPKIIFLDCDRQRSNSRFKSRAIEFPNKSSFISPLNAHVPQRKWTFQHIVSLRLFHLCHNFTAAQDSWMKRASIPQN